MFFNAVAVKQDIFSMPGDKHEYLFTYREFHTRELVM